jgi:Tol biopolymer transport system component
MGRRPSGLLVTAFLLVAGAAAARAASFPPDLHFRSVSTPRVTIHFHQGLETLARRAATLATEILERHEARYGVHAGRVNIVLADVEDDPNGFATPLPYPLVNLRAVAPDGSEDFGNYDDWLRLLLTHELTHIVHLEEAHGLVRAGRKVLGRAPFLFPNAATPTWMVEGLATYEETQGTAFGRGRNPDVRMVLRMAALEGDFLTEDLAVAGLERWPGGQAAYLFGQAFLSDLSERAGPSVLPDLARVHSGRIIPFLDEFTARKVTGSTFHALWMQWRANEQAAFALEAEGIRSRGLTASRALTARGVRQAGPRFSPDGHWVAYTDRNLTRFRTIRLVAREGGAEHEVVRRNGGTFLAWTPDGHALVYDEPESFRLFRVTSDLRVFDLLTRKARWITRGLRARDPDVSTDGRTVVFVRQGAERSDLALAFLDGGDVRDLTHSDTGVQWSAPHWSPSGDRLVASRLLPGGMLDIVIVDPASGTVTPLTHDRARDLEPAWTPDGRSIVFRSDRDGVSNLYALRVEDGEITRLTNVLGGAFTPDISPDGREVAFASYSARGYDIHVMPLDAAPRSPVPAFVDPYPAAAAEPAASTAEDRPYRPARLILPRFWTPYFDHTSRETRFGLVSAGTDALFRHAWAGDLRYGTSTERVGGRLFYQYDRWRPTLSLSAEDESAPASRGFTRSREALARVTVPLVRTLRATQTASLAYRRRRETLEETATPDQLDLGGIEAAWALSTALQFPYSISPVEGYRLRLAVVKEAPALGSEVSLGKVIADARLYSRVFRDDDALALHFGAGLTVGRPDFERSFTVGGFPDGALLDVVGTNPAVLRGYADNAFVGRRFVDANVEYRFPLGHPQRGYRLLPLFVRHLHGTVFADVGHAWSGAFEWRDLKPAAGGALGSDLVIGHGLPLTFTLGLARGFAEKGETRAYFLTGLAF